MAFISKSTVGLRVYSDSLIPNEISKLFGCAPSYCHIKDQEILGPQAGRRRKADTGMWRLTAKVESPENLNRQISELLSKLTSDLTVWESIRKDHSIDLFCGLFMDSNNECIEIFSENLRLLGVRGITIGIDIYAPDDDS